MRLTLKLDFILDDKSLVLVVKLLGELGRDGMVGSRVFDNQALVALDALVLGGLLDGPFTDICPLLLLVLVGARQVLLGVGRLPALLPVVGELLEEIGLDCGRLQMRWSVSGQRWRGHVAVANTRIGELTVKVGSSGATEDSSTASSARAMPASMAAETAAATALNFMMTKRRASPTLGMRGSSEEDEGAADVQREYGREREEEVPIGQSQRSRRKCPRVKVAGRREGKKRWCEAGTLTRGG